LIPKAELHCHLEGSIPPVLARELAARNGVTLPDGMFDGKGHYVWQDFLSFLDAYDRVCGALRVPRDFSDVLYTYLKGAAAEGAIYVEMFCSPERPKALGISYDTWLTALEDAIDRARRDFGIEGRIIAICIRHLGPERALALAEAMVAQPHHYVVGFGMGGDEAKFTPADFAPAFRLAHEHGFGCTVHAGEVLEVGRVEPLHLARPPLSEVRGAVVDIGDEFFVCDHMNLEAFFFTRRVTCVA